MIEIDIEKSADELNEYDPNKKSMLPWLLAIFLYLAWS